MTTLRRLQRMSTRDRNKLLKSCDCEVVYCLCECAKNLLKGRIPLTKRQLNNLRRWKKCLRTLSVKHPSLKQKKKVLQKGGFLGALLAPVLSFLGGLIGNKE